MVDTLRLNAPPVWSEFESAIFNDIATWALTEGRYFFTTKQMINAYWQEYFDAN